MSWKKQFRNGGMSLVVASYLLTATPLQAQSSTRRLEWQLEGQQKVVQDVDGSVAEQRLGEFLDGEADGVFVIIDTREGSQSELRFEKKGAKVSLTQFGTVDEFYRTYLGTDRPSPKTTCENNLKMLGTAAEMYSSDHSGHYPEQAAALVPDYVAELPRCPVPKAPPYGYSQPYGKAFDNYEWRCDADHTDQGLERGFPRYNSIAGIIEHAGGQREADSLGSSMAEVLSDTPSDSWSDSAGDDSEPAEDPVPPSLARGEELYASHCTMCHGDKGQGDGPAAVSLDPRPGDLRKADAYKYGHGQAGILRSIRDGVGGTGMAPHAGMLSENEMLSLAQYVQSLQSG